jgi:hypothetical protein
MRQFLIRCGTALLTVFVFSLNYIWAASPSDTNPKTSPKAMAYFAAVVITLIVVSIVAFPSRKETWDSVADKRARERRDSKRNRNL